MRLYEKLTAQNKRLRAGLLIPAYIFCSACLLAGCGSESELLSELRRENAEDPGEEISSGEDMPAGDPAESGAGDGTESAKSGVGDETESAETGSDRELAQEAGSAAEEPASIYVHVCGAVVCPGVYEMPEGSRFYEAVETAGGFAEDACRDYLNMAAPLADGSRLEIPTEENIPVSEGDGEKTYSYYTVPEASAAQSESAQSSASELVNINTADIAGLCALPGVGEGRAKAIVEYREKQGAFRKKEDIMQVSGIGEKMYERMEAYLIVE